MVFSIRDLRPFEDGGVNHPHLYVFTLVELLVVVAIIAILVAIAIPQFANFKVRSYNGTALTDLKNFKILLESEYADNHIYPY